MALTATLTSEVGLAPGLKLFSGTITADAGDSGTLIVATAVPLMTRYSDVTAAGDFTPIDGTITQTISTSTTTGYTTFTIRSVDAIANGRFVILGR